MRIDGLKWRAEIKGLNFTKGYRASSALVCVERGRKMRTSRPNGLSGLGS